MKRLTIMLFAAGFVLSAAAQGPHHGPSFDEEGPDLLPPPQQHPFAPPDFEPQSPPMRWMENLRRENPAEFERLQQLRHEDPRAFRQQLHQALKYERGMIRLRRFPRIMQAVNEMPEEQRREFIEGFSFPPEPDSKQDRPQQQRRRFGHPFPPGPEGEPPNPEYNRLQGELNELVLAYRAANDPAEQQKLAGPIREILTQLFDLRGQTRLKHIERMEKDLERLRKNLSDRQAMRDSIIEIRFRELTTGEPFDLE
jgi:hypothetical protein